MISEKKIPEAGFPVEGFQMKFRWQKGEWEQLFNEHLKLIREDIERAKVQGKLIIYLSCPISGRGGGYSGTNVEIAEFTRMRLLKEWGTGFWILNPANYQMESKAGTGLMNRHAKVLWKDLGEKEALRKLDELIKTSPAADGDYMRMWTKVLVEDGQHNLGFNFDGFYFLAPSDVLAYFLSGDSGDLTSSIQNYFSRKYSSDSEFRDYYTVRGISWGHDYNDDNEAQPLLRSEQEKGLVQVWEKRRLDFFRFYALRASINFSLGSHDEWNIWHLLNINRVNYYDFVTESGRKNGIGNLLPGFFDGRQLNPADFVTKAITGYEVP